MVFTIQRYPSESVSRERTCSWYRNSGTETAPVAVLHVSGRQKLLGEQWDEIRGVWDALEQPVPVGEPIGKGDTTMRIGLLLAALVAVRVYGADSRYVAEGWDSPFGLDYVFVLEREFRKPDLARAARRLRRRALGEFCPHQLG